MLGSTTTEFGRPDGSSAISFNGQGDLRNLIREIGGGVDVPVVMGTGTSLLEGCCRQQRSAYRYIKSNRDRKREHGLKPLEQYERLARHIEREGGIDSGDFSLDETEVHA